MARKSPKSVAEERIEYLYKLAKSKLKSSPSQSRRYVDMLRKLATKHNLIITSKKRTFCLDCNTLLNASTSSTRIRKNTRIITCKNCGKIKRLKISRKP